MCNEDVLYFGNKKLQKVDRIKDQDKGTSCT